MRALWVAMLLLGLGSPAQPQAEPLGLDLLADGEAPGLIQDGVSALHREYDKSWRHRAGSAAAEPAADDEDVAEGDAGGPAKQAEDSAFEDALPPKRRRYSRKRPRPQGSQGQEDADGEPAPGVPTKRRKPPREDDADAPADDYRRRKPSQRRRRPHRPEAGTGPGQDAEGGEEEARANDPTQAAAAQPSVASAADLKSLLKQTAGQLSLSELLQNRNLSLSDLLKGNRGALSALSAQNAHANDATPPQSAPAPAPAPTATDSTSTTTTTTTASASDAEPATERHNGFVPSKPRRLPPTPRTTLASAPPRAAPAEEPEVTTSRPRRLPAVVARVKEQQHQKEQQHAKGQGMQGQGADVLDPMNPAMMAMITLEAADSHTSKPRRIPPPAATSTASPGTTPPTPGTSPDNSKHEDTPAKTEPTPTATAPSTTSTTTSTMPPREFYPLNVDSLEITTPRLMGVSKASSQSGKAAWLPPADRIIDAQVFSPGTIAKFRPHGFVASNAHSEANTLAPPSAPQPQGAATLQNTADHFRLENETLDLKEGNALDKRKIATPPAPGREQANATTSAAVTNDLAKADKRKPLVSTATSTSTSTSTGPRRLPPTLAGTRRLPTPNSALTRPKSTTEAPPPPPPERPRLPFLSGKRAKDRERERDALLPPTRFALPLPEVISIEKMIADARSRGALDGTTAMLPLPSSTTERPPPTTHPTTPPVEASTTASTTTTFASHDEILDLLKSEQSSTRLARILAERNMTLEDLLQHRERGSSQLHFADFVRSDRNASATGKPTEDTKPVDLVPKEIAPAERKESVNILRSFHEVPKYPFAYSNAGAGEIADDSEEAASTLSLVNVKPAGIVLPADPGERYQPRSTAAAPSRAPRVIPPQQQPPPPPPPPPHPYPIPTFRLPEPPAHASNPYLVIKHVATDDADVPVLEHVGEIRQVGVSSSVEEAMVVDSIRDRPDRPDRLDRLDRLPDRMALPSGVKSAIIASTVICGLAIVGFLTIFIVFRWRQKRALIRARGAILCEQLQRGSFRGRSLSPVLVNVSKSSHVQPMQQQHTGPVPYYSKKDLSSRATSNTASNRHYYLWRSLRKTFQEDDME